VESSILVRIRVLEGGDSFRREKAALESTNVLVCDCIEGDRKLNVRQKGLVH
jgi:hypothetical protein